MELEQVLANAGRPRKVVSNGREWYVADASLIVPGVLNGSKGPLLYEEAEVSRNVDSWNGIPLVLRHPTVNGKPVSARKPDVLEAYELGRVFAANYDGKLVAEAWFDVELTKKRDATLATNLRILPKLERGEPIELSTGLFTQNEEARGKWGDKEYTHIARNFRPDHLAVLPDERGACSLKDGCGINVNTEQEKGVFSKLWSWLKGDSAAYTEFLANVRSTTPETPPMAQKADVDFLIANCDCWQEADRETLNKLPDEKVAKLKAGVVANHANTLVVNAVKEKYGSLNVNEFPPKKEEELTDEEKKKKEAMEKNSAGKPQTDEEFLANAPPAIRALLVNALATQKREQAEVVTKLTAVANSTKDASKKALIENKLKQNLPLADLQELAVLTAEPVVNVIARGDALRIGPGAGPTNNAPKEREPLQPPTVNWAERAKLPGRLAKTA